MTSLLIVGIVLLALLGAPIFACMTAFAALGASSLNQDFAGELTRVLSLATGAGASTLSTIPLFTFAGYVMAEARCAERMVGFARSVVGWIPGGLALVTIVACAIFTTFTGASGVTIVALGGLLLPSLLKENYRERFALGLVTGTGSIGLLFPPALPIIVYGIIYGISAQATADTGQSASLTLVDFSIDRFLLAGIVPGLLLIGAVGTYAVVMAIRDKVPRTPFDGGAAIKATITALPEIAIPALIILTLVMGWLQIPESAALTALYVVAIEVFFYRDVKLRSLPKIARNSLALVGAIFIIIVAATALTDYFINANVPLRLYEWMERYIHSRWSFLFALNVLLLVVGCLMDIFSAIVVVVPLIAPAAALYGIDPYHLGVIFLLNLEIGYLTPPVGLNLFITSFRFRTPMVEVYKAAIPFILVMLGALALVTYVPALTPIKSKAHAVAADKPAAETKDAGVSVTIHWPDGGAWTPERCESPEIKEDSIAHAECTAMFKLWVRCEALTEELDKIECRDKVLGGGDPFEPDAGDGPDAGTSPAIAGGQQARKAPPSPDAATP
ncbi:MAG: TRAP transporter large permease [Deltaproteobacteria bacterium]|nr:TRAP transporter large permease [Deltaproteobacteria bacterium]